VKYDRIVDIGKAGKKRSWATEEPDHEGTDLDECIEKLIDSPGKGPVAIGGRIRLRGVDVPKWEDHARLQGGRRDLLHP
jgi:hypothetical protein